MRRIGLFLVLLFFGSIQVFAQTDNPRKIKVYLLGTFHFAQTEPSYNVLEEKHQKEINKLNDIIVRLNPDKIFIERMPDFEYQNKMDSLYTAYLAMEKETTNRNEIWQVAFKVGKRLGHKKLYQCDYAGNFGNLYQQVEEYAGSHNQEKYLEYKGKGTTMPLTVKANENSLRHTVSLLEYLKWLNSKEVQSSSHAHYINVYPQIGNTDVYKYNKDYLLGTQLTADWYRRNINIYSLMINQLDYNEDSIFLIMGNDHIPIIRNLFESNPYFEVVDTQKWLGKTKIKLK